MFYNNLQLFCFSVKCVYAGMSVDEGLYKCGCKCEGIA